MNPVFPARRRANAFSAMVEQSTSRPGEHMSGAADDKYADLLPLVGLVTTLRSTPGPEARPEFVSDLRSRLMLAAETALAPDTAAQVEARRQPAPRRTGRERRLAVAVGGFAIVSASASMSVAAQSALPGDTLYPLKRALENVHENVLRDADDKGSTMLDNASGRLDEVDRLSRAGTDDAEVIAQTLEDFTDQAVEASDVLLGDYEETGRLSSIEELRSFTASSLAALERLRSLVPIEARSSLIAAARVLDDIDRLAVTVCPACSALPSIEDVAVAADLGPIYEQLLADTPDQPAPARPTPSAPAKPAKPAPQGQPAPIESPEPEAEAEEPEPPTLPSGNGGGGGGGADNPLGDALTGLHDPLGDLLTGVTATVDNLLPGSKKP